MKLTEEEREDIALALEAKADIQRGRIDYALQRGTISTDEALWARGERTESGA